MTEVITAHDLGITLDAKDECALFKWFVASFLMGKRIQAPIAAKAYHVLVNEHGCDSPDRLARLSHRQLVAILGKAHYVRYDESTATRLSALALKLVNEYGGRFGSLYSANNDRQAFERRLLEFDGVGPKTVEIFMRDAAPVLF